MWKTVGLEAERRERRTPPTPSTISWRSRWLAVAAVELVGDRARPVRVAVDVRVEQVERHAADLGPPDLGAHGRRARRVVRELDRTVALSGMSGRRAESFSG